MTGGWKPYRDEDLPKRWPRPALVISEAEQETDEILKYWVEAARFRHAATLALREQGVTFAQWRVVYTTHRLVEEQDDPASEQAIAKRSEMDVSTVSAVVRRLSLKGLLDCSFDAWGWSYRILVTARGVALLESAHSGIARAFAESRCWQDRTAHGLKSAG